MVDLFVQYGYWILFPLVIIEGPITILILSLVANKIGMSFEFLFMLSLLGELGGDLLHYIIGMYSRKKITQYKKENNKYLVWIEEKLHDKSLLDMLIVIKYFPPITSIGLIYLGYKQVNFKKFLKLDAILVLINSIVVVTIGYYSGKYFLNSDNMLNFFIVLMFFLAIIYFAIKYIKRFIVNQITHDKL